jgi:hypothetical protein
MMRSITKIDIGRAALYGAVLMAFWTLAFGIYYWILGWVFGASSWWIDMNLVNWTGYTFRTLLLVLWRMLINGLGGALGGLIIALVYNAVSGIMGGIKIELSED